MPESDCESMLQGLNPEVRLIQIGGRTRYELLGDLNSAGIKLNEHAMTLLKCDKFQTDKTPHQLRVVVVSVRDLGFPHGAGIREIEQSALERNLSLCPLELAPHFRLQYRDQPEGFIGHPTAQQNAPPGSITVACEPIGSDDNFPKGFYLRCIEGTQWLRGYRSDNEHLWGPDDRLAFCQA
jgi:hypothetical protein